MSGVRKTVPVPTVSMLTEWQSRLVNPTVMDAMAAGVAGMEVLVRERHVQKVMYLRDLGCLQSIETCL